MRFSPDFLDDLRIRIPISTLVGTRITFDKKKSNASRGDYWACCPFHSEKTPSFRCNDRKSSYYCFGCGASGDHFSFLSKLDGISFMESVERVADIVGVSLPTLDLSVKKSEKHRADLYHILEQATQFFEKSLLNKAGEHAREYITNRALTDNLQKIFRIGYACNSRNQLKNFLSTKGISEQKLVNSGLLISGTGDIISYDRFRDRIMFPIEDIRGKIVGFGGRALANHVQAKYLNSPETELFHKGELLYNFSRAKRANQTRGNIKKNQIIVVEGYMDVISLVGAGFSQTVASLGTSLTERQLALLWNVCDQPILCFDGDDAGKHAAFRTLDRAMPLLRARSSLSFVLLPNKKDPDDIIRTGGAFSFQELLFQAMPLVEMLWYKETFGKDFSTPERCANLEKHLRKAILKIKDESLRYYYLHDIRKRLHNFFQPPISFSFSNKVKKAHISPAVKNNRYPFVATTKRNFVDIFSKKKILEYSSSEKKFSTREAMILFILMNHLQLWNENFEILASLKFTDSRLAHLHHVMLDILALNFPKNTEEMKDLLTKKGKTKILALITQRMYNVGVGVVIAQSSPQAARQALREAVSLHWLHHSKQKKLNEVAEEIYKSSEQAASVLCTDLKTRLSPAIVDSLFKESEFNEDEIEKYET